MTTTPLALRGRTARPEPTRRRRAGAPRHLRAILAFVLPFTILFALFYALPVGYAIWESLLVVKRDGTFGQAHEVFGWFSQYALVFQNGPFWLSVGRVLLFGVVQVPVMLALALVFALLLDSPWSAASGSSASRTSPPMPCRASSPRSCGASSSRRTSRRSPT
jgi:multiple sugar transport system permease protein